MRIGLVGHAGAFVCADALVAASAATVSKQIGKRRMASPRERPACARADPEVSAIGERSLAGEGRR
jgi:hypothetical protein